MGRYSRAAVKGKRKGLTKEDHPGPRGGDYTKATPYQRHLQKPIKKRAKYRDFTRKIGGIVPK